MTEAEPVLMSKLNLRDILRQAPAISDLPNLSCRVVLLLCISLAALDGVPHLNLTGVACLNTELVTGHLQIYRYWLMGVNTVSNRIA